MSENILIGKNRKTGKWEFLCDPSEVFDNHLKAYQKISRTAPVNDTYSKILFGRCQNTHTPMTLITTEENKSRQEMMSRANTRGVELSKSAAERQAKIDKTEADKQAQAHQKIIEEKTVQINQLRKATGQSLVEVPKQPEPAKADKQAQAETNKK